MTQNATFSLAGPATLFGRLLLTFIFLASAGNKIMNFGPTTEYMAANGVPLPPVMLVGAIILLVLGGLSLAAGFRARIGASMLLVFLIAASWYFHAFWTYEDPGQAQMQTIQFMKNLSMAGAMIMVMAHGSGPWSLDSRWAAKE